MFLDALAYLGDFLEPMHINEIDTLTDAQLERRNLKALSDLGAEMEYIMEKETDPLIRKKLEWRMNSGIYEWEDLYK